MQGDSGPSRLGCLAVDGVTPLRGARNRRAASAEKPAARDRQGKARRLQRRSLRRTSGGWCPSPRVSRAGLRSAREAMPAFRFGPAPAVTPLNALVERLMFGIDRDVPIRIALECVPAGGHRTRIVGAAIERAHRREAALVG